MVDADTEKRKVVTMRLSEDLYARLARLAEKDMRSLNAQATYFLAAAIEKREEDDAKKRR